MSKIVKRTLKRTGEVRYVVDFYDLTGKRRKERFRRERDAKVRLGQVVAQRETGELRPRADDTRLKELVADWRLAHWADIRPNTQTVYARLLDNWILPELGERKLRTILLADCEQLRAKIVEGVATSRRAKGGRVSANMALGLLRQILNYAEKHRRVVSNVARHVKAKSAPFEEQRAKIEREVLSPTELRSLLDAADSKYRALIMTAALTGLRRGELLGLQWGDIDWQSNRLHVRRQMNSGKLTAPKSASALRAVPLPGELVHELKKWKLACPKGELGLAFPNDRGGLASTTTVDVQGLQPALRRAGLRRVSWHALRHGYASALISAGVSIKVAQRLLGHANVQITLNTYAHLLPGDDASAAAALSTRLFGTFSVTPQPAHPANPAAAPLRRV